VAGAGGGDGGARTRPAREKPRPVERLGLRQQVGQTLVSSFDGTTVPAYLRRRLEAGETAGVILFARNVAGRDAVRSLTRSLQAPASGGALVMADQEGGPVRTLPFAAPATAQPSQRDPGGEARRAARDLRAVGVNVNLAPVADVAGPGSALQGRAFAGGPHEVATKVAAAVRGYAGGGVAATAKHFPGLGRAARNTDDAPVTIEDRPELETFRAAIGAGTPLVMTSHALYPRLDRTRIASQSPAVLERLLRRELGFKGATITDSIEAEAVLRRFKVAEAAERSLAAGADLVLMTGSASWRLAFPRVLDRARRDPAFRRRVRQAAARVLALKRRLGLRAPRPSPARAPAP
jgi:beta-N-acetylhexosaminidase